MAIKQGMIGAGVGAALAATVVVTVYEGRVQVKNAHGSTEVNAGGSVGASADQAPSAALAAVGGDAKKAAALAGAPPESATRDAGRARLAPLVKKAEARLAEIREYQGRYSEAVNELDALLESELCRQTVPLTVQQDARRALDNARIALAAGPRLAGLIDEASGPTAGSDPEVE